MVGGASACRLILPETPKTSKEEDLRETTLSLLSCYHSPWRCGEQCIKSSRALCSERPVSLLSGRPIRGEVCRFRPPNLTIPHPNFKFMTKGTTGIYCPERGALGHETSKAQLGYLSPSFFCLFFLSGH